MSNVSIKSETIEAAKELAISSNDITRTLQSPDDIQVLEPPKMRGNNNTMQWPVFTLYLKRFNAQFGEEDHYVLIEAIRENGQDRVSAVWRIYLSDLNLNEPGKPFDILSKFTNKYGFKTNTKSGLASLLLYKICLPRLKVENNVKELVFDIFENIITDEDRRVTETPVMKMCQVIKQVKNEVWVAMFYTINMSNYLHDLKIRGVISS